MTDWFRVKRQDMPTAKYTMTTVERQNVPHEGRVLHGLAIEPLSGSGKEGSMGRITLPACIESKTIPDSLDEIPDREDVRKIPGLEHLAERFPKKDGNWKTVLLLGRNCIEVMGEKQAVNSRNGAPRAVHTPLGWALIGVDAPGMAELDKENGD